MANLTNSQRSLLKATYVPTRVSAGNPASTQRTVEKVAMLRQLNLQPGEFKELAVEPNVQKMAVTLVGKQTNPYDPKSRRIPLLQVVQSLTTDISSGATSKFAPLLAGASPDLLNSFVQTVARERQAQS